MTIQANDTVFRKKIAFELVGGSGSGLFNVKSLGFTPRGRCTACWRGYLAEYSILENRLFLTALQVWFPSDYKDLNKAAIESATDEDDESFDEEPPDPNASLNIPLFGVMPKRGSMGGCFYEGFRKPIQFTGKLVLGEDLLPEPFVSRNYWLAWQLRIVRELTFKKGRVISDKSISAKMAKVRAEYVERHAQMKMVATTTTKADRERTRALIEKMGSPFD